MNKISVFILCGAAFLIMPVALFAHKGIAIIFILFCSLIILNIRKINVIFIYRGYLTKILLIFFLYIIVSSFWSFNPSVSLKSSFFVIASLICGCLMVSILSHASRYETRLAELALIAGGAFCYSIIAFEVVSNGLLFKLAYPLFGIHIRSHVDLAIAQRPGFIVAAIYLWMWTALILRNFGGRIAAVCGLLVAFILTTTNEKTVLVSLAFSLSVTVLAYWVKRRSHVLLTSIVIICLALAPAIVDRIPNPTEPGFALPNLSKSAAHRILIWKNANRLIDDHPIFGYGLATSKAIYGPDSVMENNFIPDVPGLRWTNLSEPIPLHPHNAILQIWLELGVIGVILIGSLLIFLLRYINNSQISIEQKFLLNGFLFSYFSVANISFNIWQSWWFSFLILMVVLSNLVLSKQSSN